eukprot:TRINITY_DN12568_c0_g1_i2.p2 TRINITY_DN12568_c0_g1~~TRINITY_DN12568_c0_g1_i2.p2  ORF type:complete len:195 (+),score=22.52 TRINITY_DN12568_c0_g1_i2:417-1001(+)
MITSESLLQPQPQKGISSDLELKEIASLQLNQAKPILEFQNQEKNKFNSKDLKGKMVVVTIIIHSFLETIALGVMDSTWQVSNLLTAIIVHKWALSLILTYITIQSFENLIIARALIVLFILSGGIGAGIGIIFSTFGNMAQVYILTACAGVYLYVAQECLQENAITQKICNKYKLIAIFFGILIIAVVKIFDN